MRVAQVPNRSEVDRFEREIACLRTLDHPSIPGWVLDSHVGYGTDAIRYLVTEQNTGLPLTEELKQQRYTEADIAGIIRDLLNVLGYLQELRPPVIHGGLRLDNIVRTNLNKLIIRGFGAYDPTTKLDPTESGALGYRPPEQLGGQLLPVSDIYSVGAIGLAMVSRQSPASLLGEGSDWTKKVRCGQPLRGVLQSVLERDPEQRPADPSVLAKRLGAAIGQQIASLSSQTPHPAQPPEGSRAVAAPRQPGPQQLGPLVFEPPPTPRARPRGLLLSLAPVTWFKRMLGRILGGAGLVVGALLLAMLPESTRLLGLLPILIGGGVGGWAMTNSHRQQKRILALWECGQVCIGQVLAAQLDPQMRLNNKPLIQVKLGWEVGGKSYQTLHRSQDGRLEHVTPGSPISLLYDPEKPDLVVPYLP